MLVARPVYSLKNELIIFCYLSFFPLIFYLLFLIFFSPFLHFINIPLLSIILKKDIINLPASQEA